MQIRGYELTYPRLLLGALVVVVVAAGIVGLSTSSAAFGSYNPGWDGTSDLRTLASETGATTELTQETVIYERVAPEETIAFVLSPTDRYDPGEVDRVRGFVRAGGTVVVAGDFAGTANSLLTDLGVASRLDGRPVRDERRYYRGPSLPVATNIVEGYAVTANVSRLTLNHPTVVAPGRNSTILVNTSGYAYVDANGNQALDDDETLRERPVVVAESLGDGRVVVVSDPSVFINAMLDVPDNRQFASNLVTDTGTVVFDYSHRTGIPWAVAVVATVADQPLLQLVLVVLLTGVCIVSWYRRKGLGLPWADTTSDQPVSDVGLSREDVIARVTGRHPEWNEERVERVARGIMSGASSEHEND